MPKTKRVQVLMDPKEYEALEQIAAARGASVADLMREAARQQHLRPIELAQRYAAAQQFLALDDVALPPWAELKQEIQARRGR